jgi:hypothetical protein
MSNETAAEFLNLQISAKHRLLLPGVAKQGYAVARMLMAASPVYAMPSAQDNRARFVSWCVEFGLMALIRSGRWPVDFRWEKYGKVDKNTGGLRYGTGHYLLVQLRDATLTVCQTDDPKKQPRDVRFRQNARLANQPLLKGLELPEEPPAGQPTILLTHGHRDLAFVQLGICNPEHSQGYAYRTPNLLLLPQELPSDTTRVEQTDFDEAVLTLKADIEKWQTDNAG